MNAAARTAQINGTRQMIADDSFAALVAVLVDCKAVPTNIMASVLDRLADHLVATARGDLESDFAVYPAEAFDRARSLCAQAARLRGGAAHR